MLLLLLLLLLLRLNRFLLLLLLLLLLLFLLLLLLFQLVFFRLISTPTSESQIVQELRSLPSISEASSPSSTIAPASNPAATLTPAPGTTSGKSNGISLLIDTETYDHGYKGSPGRWHRMDIS